MLTDPNRAFQEIDLPPAEPAPWEKPGWYHSGPFVRAVLDCALCVGAAAATNTLNPWTALVCAAPLASWAGLKAFASVLQAVRDTRKDGAK